MTGKGFAVLFDLDGVTVDTEPLYSRAEIRLFKEYGVEIPKEDWGLFRGSSEETFFNLSMERYNIIENRNIFIKKGRKYVREEFEKNISFVSGFKNLIDRISSQYITGLVTASPVHSLDWIRKRMNLDKYFQYIISGEETQKNKPHPHPYIEMMQRIGIKPYNTIIIEDSMLGLSAALASDAHVVALNRSIAGNKLNNAHKVINHLDELTLEALEDLLQRPI